MMGIPSTVGWDGPMLACTPKDTLATDGTARLYRFRRQPQAGAAAVAVAGGTLAPVAHAGQQQLPVLLVPSLINRWYVLDLRPGSSLVEALVGQGLDVWCLDWGIPEAEDRYITWQDVLERLHRLSRRVLRETGAPKLAVLGYCIGATVSAIHAALHHEQIAALVNLAGPFDFSRIGKLGRMTDARWFDAEAIAAGGNMGAEQMQAGFQSLRPTAQVSKWVNWLDRAHDKAARDSFAALETWASDNIPFPAAAYETWVTEFYQQNQLVRGEHRVGGRRVDLGAITCPLLTVVTERDEICPPAAAAGLEQLAASTDKTTLTVPGGHVGAVVGRHAKTNLYPAMARWLEERTWI
jgi:polyhydroxyalkanoate synthase